MKISRTNKYIYFLSKIIRSASKNNFTLIEWALSKFNCEIKIEWSGNKLRIPCSKIPHLSIKYSNRFKNFTYRIVLKKIN